METLIFLFIIQKLIGFEQTMASSDLPLQEDLTLCIAVKDGDVVPSTPHFPMKGGGEVVQSIIGIIFSLILVCASLFVIVWSFVTYFTYKDDDCDKPLAEWCLAYGCVSCVCLLMQCLVHESKENVAYFLNGMFSIALLVVGSIFVFSMDADDHECPDGLFDFVFYLLIVLWSFDGLLVVGIACFMCAYENN